MQVNKPTKEAEDQLNKEGATTGRIKQATSKLNFDLSSPVSSVPEPDVSGISDNELGKRSSGKKWEKPAEPVKPPDESKSGVISAELRTAVEEAHGFLLYYRWKRRKLLENERLFEKEMFQRAWELLMQKLAEADDQLSQVMQEEELKRTGGVLRHRLQGEVVKEAESKLKRLEVEEQAAQTKNVISAKLRAAEQEASDLFRAYRRKREVMLEKERLFEKMFRFQSEYLRQKFAEALALEKPRQILQKDDLNRIEGALRHKRQGDEVKAAESRMKWLEEILEIERYFEEKLLRLEREFWWRKVPEASEKPLRILQKEELKRAERVLRLCRQGEEVKEVESKLKRLEVEEQAAQTEKGISAKLRTADEDALDLLRAQRRQELMEKEMLFQLTLLGKKFPQASEKPRQILQEEELKRTEGALCYRWQGKEVKEAESRPKRLEEEEEAAQTRKAISVKLETAEEEPEVLLGDYPWSEEMLENERLLEKEMLQREWKLWGQMAEEAKMQPFQILHEGELKRTEELLRHSRQGEEVKETEGKLKRLELEEQAAETEKAISVKPENAEEEPEVLLRDYPWSEEMLGIERLLEIEMLQREWELLGQRAEEAKMQLFQILHEGELKKTEELLRHSRQGEEVKETEGKLKRLELEEQAAETAKVLSAKRRTTSEEYFVLLRAYLRKKEELLAKEHFLWEEMTRLEFEHRMAELKVAESLDLGKSNKIAQKEELKRSEGVLRHRRQGEEVKEAESKVKRLEIEEQAAQTKKEQIDETSQVTTLNESASGFQDAQLSFCSFDQPETVLEAEDGKDITASEIVTDKGASLSVKGVSLICPPGAVKDPVRVQLTLEEPYKYCYLIARCGLQNDVSFVAPIVNCQPNGQKFEKCVTVKITLNSKGVKSDGDLLVLHGTRTGQNQMIHWEDVTDKSRFHLQTQKLEVKISQFSLFTALKVMAKVNLNKIVPWMNVWPFDYNLSVLFKINQQQRHLDEFELALVFMSQETYQVEYYRDHDGSAIMRLKKDGFEELPTHSKNAQGNVSIRNNDTLNISIQLGEDYKLVNNQQKCFEVVVDSTAWWNTGHAINIPLQASNTNSKVVCGNILVEDVRGNVHENKFCQKDLFGYVRQVLAVKKEIFDVKAVAQKLELPTETQHQVVAWWQSERKQLELALLHWREKHGDGANPNDLKKALEELEPEEYKVKERGQMHIEHLRALAFKMAGLRHHDSDPMKYFGLEVKKLCKAVLRDCCIENATSKEEMELAIRTENFASLLVMKKRLSENFGNVCTCMFSSQDDEFITSRFLCIVFELIQAIKEIFREEKIQRTPSGLKGVEEATLQNITSDIRNAAHDEDIFKLWSEVCHILEILCRNNNDDRERESQIQRWRSCAMMIEMLCFLERFFQCTEESRLYKRLEFFSFLLGDIMSNRIAFDRSFSRDFHNVAVSLLKFAKFDPSHSVQFELKSPANSITYQKKDNIKYDMSGGMFSQLFWIIKKCDENLQLEATAHVHIAGQLLTLGAFEAMIFLPKSYGEVVENAPITSFPVSFKSETDRESSSLRVTLYSTQKDNISKALEYLQTKLDGQSNLLKQTKIKETSLKLLNVAKAGTALTLCLTHRWGSGTIGVESNSFVPQPLGYSSSETRNNLETTDEHDQHAFGESSLLAAEGTSDANSHNRDDKFRSGPSSAFSTLTTRSFEENVGNYTDNPVSKGDHVCVPMGNAS